MVTNLHIRLLPPCMPIFNTMKQLVNIATFEGEDSFQNLEKCMELFEPEFIELVNHGLPLAGSESVSIPVRLWGSVVLHTA